MLWLLILLCFAARFYYINPFSSPDFCFIYIQQIRYLLINHKHYILSKKTFLLQIDKKYTIMSAQKKLLSYYYCQAFNNNRFYKHKERLPGLILIK